MRRGRTSVKREQRSPWFVHPAKKPEAVRQCPHKGFPNLESWPPLDGGALPYEQRGLRASGLNPKRPKPYTNSKPQTQTQNPKHPRPNHQTKGADGTTGSWQTLPWCPGIPRGPPRPPKLRSNSGATRSLFRAQGVGVRTLNPKT